MKCDIKRSYLNRLKRVYGIPDDVDLKVHGLKDTLNHPPRRYVTLYLKCFKVRVKLPLQLYFVRVLGIINLAIS